MLKKENLLSHVLKEDDKIFLTRILDQVERTLRNHQIEYTDFLDPYQVFLVRPILKGIYEVNYKFAGGYPEAERQRIVIFPDYYPEDQVEDRISWLKVEGNFKFQKVTHRDYLGSVLGLGLKREKFGDILVVEDGCLLFGDSELADYIVMNLIKIHRVSVTVKVADPETIKLPEEKAKIIETTVASLRLDVIAAAGFGFSRSKMVKEMGGEKLKLNWAVTDNLSQQISEGDVISLRGKGRLRIDSIKGETAKGRIKICIKRLI